MNAATDPAPAPRKETPKETLISVVMSFAMVFIFTRFVMASYVIPTGSMAPTLMGAHLRFYSPQSGQQWPVNPWAFTDKSERVPLSLQWEQDPSNLTRRGPVRPIDSITAQPLIQPPEVPLRSGDRIFVLNYLEGVTSPKRWDVTVFKFPGDARENYIKRLVGMPGESLLLIDGDVFTRPAGAAEWSIQRKPDHVQRSLWRTIFSSELRPLDDTHNARPWPERWVAQGLAREGLGYDKPQGAALLRWEPAAQPIDDWVLYNDTPWMSPRIQRFPVSDLRIRAAIRPQAEGLALTATIAARSHLFQAAIEQGRVVLRMRRDPDGAPAASPGELQWAELASAPFAGLAPERFAQLEFWHADQELELWLDGRRLLRATYDWTPRQRLDAALASPGAPITLASAYRKPRVVWTFDGPAATLSHVGLDRDLYYQPATLTGGVDPRTNEFRTTAVMLRAADPDRPLDLGPGQHFLLGDNSAASGDGRAWGTVDPWVADQIDDTLGIVPRDLMMGKAFVVFFPSLLPGKPLPVFDFGRMRLIW